MDRSEHTTVDDQPGGRALQLLWLWVTVVVFYFAWEAASYRGLFAILSEWEFDRLGQDLPTFNYTILSMCFAWPGLLLLRHQRERLVRAEEEAVGEPTAHGDDSDEILASAYLSRQRYQEMRLTLLTSRDYMNFLYAFAAALGFAGFMVFAWTVTLPDQIDKPRRYTPSMIANERAVEGPARFDGELRYGRIASFSRGILFARRTSLYAPIFPPKGSDGQIRYFVEFLPAERSDIHSGGLLKQREGVLVRADLPGALIRLYRYLGYQPAPGYHVLYVSPFTLRWPHYIVAGQLLLGSLIFFFSGLWQRWHLRRLSRDIARRLGLATRRHPLAVATE